MSPDDRRKAIVEATCELVLEHGPSVTTRQIADACGIAEGTLFRVFESKDDILRAVVQELMDPAFVIERVQAIPSDLPVARSVVWIMEILDAAHTRIRSVMIALHAARETSAPPERRGPGDLKQFAERQKQLNDAIAAVLSRHDEDLRVGPQVAAQFIQVTAFAHNIPFVTQLEDPGVLSDLVVHALVKEPSCSVMPSTAS